MNIAANDNQQYLVDTYLPLLQILENGKGYASVRDICGYLDINKDTLRAKCLCRSADIEFPYVVGGNNRVKIPVLPFLKWMTSFQESDITALVVKRRGVN